MIARSIAFLFAATTTWLGNRWLTFSQSNKANPLRQWQKFMMSACISALPNFIVFKGVTLFLGTQGFMVYVALVLGILTGMVSNYLLSSKWVFRQEWGISTFPALSWINQATYSHHSSSFLILSFTELSINRVRSALGFFVCSLPFFSLICVFLKFATSYKYELGLI